MSDSDHSPARGPSRIMVVDDDEQCRKFCSTVLRQAGYEVTSAENGLGVFKAADESLDLVLCDVYMPDMDGLETIRRLRRERPTLRIIAMSGGAGGLPDFLASTVRFGASATLSKPFSPARLLEVVASALERDDPAEG